MGKESAELYGISSDETTLQSDKLTEFLIKIGEKLYNPAKIIVISVVTSEIISIAIIYLFCEYFLKNHNLASYLVTMTIAFVCSFSISVLLVFIIKKFTDLVQKQKNIIEAEKKKSDRLLLNVLPYRIIDNLKISGESKPELFQNVTIFFSDFVGFTNLSSTTNPEDLISELNEIFTRFDEIMQKHDCERIKTIGDAFLSVCGMPDPIPDHAEKMINASKEIIQYLNERNKNSRLIWQVRIGIHSGPVVGGIVGIHKYIYDIFGDSVNTASRMESLSEPMKITISESTFNLIKDKFSYTEKAEVNVKGKGSMKTYFIE